jgi:uncharacterized membrane protein
VLYGFVAPLHQMREAREGKKKSSKTVVKKLLCNLYVFWMATFKRHATFFFNSRQLFKQIESPKFEQSYWPNKPFIYLLLFFSPLETILFHKPYLLKNIYITI